MPNIVGTTFLRHTVQFSVMHSQSNHSKALKLIERFQQQWLDEFSPSVYPMTQGRSDTFSAGVRSE